MALLRNAPWNWAQPVVDDTGSATPEFLAWLQQQLNTTKLANEAVPSSRLISTGLGLTGGGDLSSDRTITLNAVIDNLLDVNTATTPPTNGQALVWNSGSGMWVPGTIAAAISVKEEGAVVVSAATSLNFIGSTVTVTNGGSGQADITIIGGGGGGGIYAPVSNGTTPGPILLDNGAGECIMAQIA